MKNTATLDEMQNH